MADPINVTSLDLDAATRTLDGEARGEPLLGQQAVAWVIRTRATWQPPAWWGHTVAAVCLHPYQFSCQNPTDPNYAVIHGLATTDPKYQALYAVVNSVMTGAVDNPVPNATHYKVVGTAAAWAQNQVPAQVIGHHEFYCLTPGS
jgi:N-acetylmuramoyl-L-alanine amidase